jgi:hypothetical protein
VSRWPSTRRRRSATSTRCTRAGSASDRSLSRSFAGPPGGSGARCPRRCDHPAPEGSSGGRALLERSPDRIRD